MTDTVSCLNCGTELPAGAMFCTNCGTKMELEASSGAGGSGADTVTVSADDQTRVDTPALQDATQVLPGAPPAGSSPPTDATQVIPSAEPPAWTPPPPPPQAPWQPPTTAAPQPGAWQPPPPPQPDWAQPTPATAGQGWAAPTTPNAPPSQWQQPQPGQWSPGAPTAAAPTSTSAGVGQARTSAGAAAALAFVGAILLVAGVFGLWLQSANGSSVKLTAWEMVTKKDEAGPLRTPDPAILLGIAAASIVVGGLLVAGKYKALMRILLAVAGIGAAVVLVSDYLSIKDAVKDNFVTGTTIDFKYGFWLAAAGAVILAGAAVVPSRKQG